MSDKPTQTPTVIGRLIEVMTQGDGTGLASTLQNAQQGMSEGLQQLLQFDAGFNFVKGFAQGVDVPDAQATGVNAVQPLSTPDLVGSQGYALGPK